MRISDWSSDVCSSDLFAVRVHAGHFGGFAADQGAAGQFATAGDALDHGGGGVHVQLAAGEVVEEEQRLGTLHQDEIGRASCRESVSVRVDLGGRRIIKKKK